MSLMRLFLSLLAVSILLIYYSGYREKQCLDSYLFNQKNEKIQEDWKNIIDYFPNGLVLISLKKNVLFRNKTLIELLDLKSEMSVSIENMSNANVNVNERDCNYLTLVEKIGKIEEVFPNKDSFADNINTNKRKFSITSNNNDKRLGYSPVNISSNSFSYRGGLSNSHIINNDFNSAIQRKFSFGESMNKSEEATKKGSATMKIEVVPNKDLNLDKVINQMRKGLSKMKASEFDNDNEQSGIRTFCTQFRNYVTPAKTNRKFEVKIKPVVYKSDLVLMVVIQDVSFMDMVQELRENNDYKNKVLTTLSHELRTPLNGAITPLEKLLNEEKLKNQDSLIYSRLNIGFKSLLLLQNVLNDVVDFALINSNQLYLNYEEVGFQKFLRETLDIFQTQADEKGLDLMLIFDNEKKIFRDFKTDFQRLRQILVSLLNNAIKNTFKGSIQLEVSLQEESLDMETSKSPTFELINRGKSVPKISIKNGQISSTKAKNLDFEKDKEKVPDKTLLMFNENGLSKYLMKLIVRDTGVGIESSRLRNIRKSLSSDDLLVVCTNLNRKNGCGLGLIISQCLSLLLGPRSSKGLDIISDEGLGTEISFLLEGFIEVTHDEEERSGSFLSIIEENKLESSNIYGTFTVSSKKSSMSCDLIKKNQEKFLYSKTSQLLLKTQEEEEKTEFFATKSQSLMNRHKTSEEIVDDLELDSLNEIDEKIVNFVTEHSLIVHTDHIPFKNSDPSLKNITIPIKNTATSLRSIAHLSNTTQLDSLNMIYSRKTCFCPEILIVDDDSFNILALETLLSKWNFIILKAFNGQQAIDIIREKRKTRKCSSDKCGGVRLIFLDYHMPLKNGVETTKEIREIMGLKKYPPIIGCTAFGAKDLVYDWKNAGMNDFIVKPIDSQKIERILKKWRIIT